MAKKTEKPTAAEMPNGMVVSVASTVVLTLEDELAAIETWYSELLTQARVEYKARRKAAFEKYQK